MEIYKYLKKKISILIIMFLILFIGNRTYASELNGIYIDVDLMDNGDARIEMEWNYYDDQGTEHYYPLNIENKNIKDFRVKQDGIDYEYIDDWNINASLEDKRYKNGIIENGNEIELCWGIGQYGENNYIISFIVEDMVENLKDAQLLFYTFVNEGMDPAPKKTSLRITSDKDIGVDDVRMWAFGFDGDIELIEGDIISTSNIPFEYNNHMTIMLRFDPGYFNADLLYDREFEDVKEEAFIGSDYNTDNDKKDDSSISGMAIAMILGLIGAIFVFLILMISLLSKNNDLGIDKKDYKGEYYREIPYHLNLEDLFYILSRLGISNYYDYITYYFLKWIREGIIKVEEYEEERWLFANKVKTGFSINKKIDTNNELEMIMYYFMLEAAGKNKILEEDEFNIWMSKNTSRFKVFIDRLEKDSKERLLELKYLKTVEEKTFFGNKSVQVLTDNGIELTENLIKFYNYLYDFSLLNERESVNVNIWDDLMLFAAIFGITARVEDEFEKLYPKYFEQTVYNYNAIRISRIYSAGIYNSHNNATGISAASSGLGGSSSIGGGGASRGGGFGGGTR